MAGASNSGKSTLCAALMARGLGYHCDDSAVLDREFRVASAPFGLMLREGSWSALEPLLPELKKATVYRRWGTDVRFLAPTSIAGPTHVKALIFVRYEAIGGTELEELTVFESLLELQRSGFWVEHTHERIERFLIWLGTIGRYRLHYNRLDEAEEIVERFAMGNSSTHSR